MNGSISDFRRVWRKNERKPPRIVTNAVKLRAAGRCERCKTETIKGSCHHVRYEKFEDCKPEDFLYICSRCHFWEHNAKPEQLIGKTGLMVYQIVSRLGKIGIHQRAICAAIGIRNATLEKWESGQFAPNAENAAALEEFYEMQKG